MKTRALVLFSGGQDSATCLAWALDRYDHVETVGFDYGQRHAIEMSCRAPVREAIASIRPDWRSRLGEDHLIDLGVLGDISETALTRSAEISIQENGLPNTFVPGRNLVFLTFAAALAYRRDIGNLIGGMCETDYSGYPDCRNATMRALNETLDMGMDRHFEIETPLMWLDKAATWQLALDLGGETLINIILEHTHTCYLGERGVRHSWGHGCGKCPACELRANGWQSFRPQTYSSG